MDRIHPHCPRETSYKSASLSQIADRSVNCEELPLHVKEGFETEPKEVKNRCIAPTRIILLSFIAMSIVSINVAVAHRYLSMPEPRMALSEFLKPLPSDGITECHDKCCVHAKPLVLKPYQPESVGTRAQPLHDDRVGIFEERQHLAEIWYGDLGRPAEFRGETLTRDHIPCLQNGTIIFVDLKHVSRFFNDIYPHLSLPFVLFSTDSDSSAPSSMVKHMETARGKSLIMHWYSTNCDHNDEDYPLFTCIPLGLSQWEEYSHQRLGLEAFLAELNGMRYAHGRPMFPEAVNAKRTGLALVPFTFTNRKIRPKVWSYMCQNKAWKGETVLCKNNYNHVEDLYTTALQYKFMISPHGIGLDCYRTWEALFLGMIPVVASSSLDPIYRGLPVLIVKAWTDLTPELLHHTWEVFQHKSFDFNRLYISYWQHEMWRYRERPSVKFHYSLRTSYLE